MTTAIASSSKHLLAEYWPWQHHAIHYVHATGSAVVDNGPEPEASTEPALLLVHGFGASTDHWRKNIAELRQNFDVWAIDLLGFGRSDKPDLSYSADLWRQQLHDFITHKIGRPVVLIGNSLGGYASLCMAAQHPHLVSGLVLINSAGPFSDALQTQQKSGLRATLQRFVQAALLHPLPSFLLFQHMRRRSVIRRTLLKVYHNPNAVTDQLVEDIRRPSCDSGASKVFASVFKAKQGEPVDHLLAKICCPLLMLWGEQDPWMRVRERGQRFRQHYPNLTEYFLQAGHCPHDEVPEQVNDLIRRWACALRQDSRVQSAPESP